MTPTTTAQQAAASTHARHIASAFGNVYRFAGRRFDGQTGFNYSRHRYYEARSRRFVIRDSKEAWSLLTKAIDDWNKRQCVPAIRLLREHAVE